MTVSTTIRTVTYVGNDSTTVFPYAFKIPLASDVIVTRLNTDTQVKTTLVQDTDYTITGIGGDSGGNVTYPVSGSPLSTNEKLTITRTVPLTQLLNITNQSGFDPDVLEATLDQIVMGVQQVSETIDRALRVPESDGAGVDELLEASARANLFLGFNASGAPYVTALTTVTAVVPSTGGTFTGAVTISAGGLNITAGGLTVVGGAVIDTLRVSTAIIDANSNELLTFSEIASAVNQLNLRNAATGNAPRLIAEGGDTNINMELAAKGTGVVDATSPLRASNTFQADAAVTFGDEVKCSVDSITYAASFNIDMSTESVKEFTTSATAATATLTNIAANQQVECRITCNSASASLAWSGVDLWVGGTAPTLTTTVDEVDIIVLSVMADGATVIGEHIGVAA